MDPAVEKLRIVIVGGVAGGASAAARARRCHPQAEITILEKGKYVSFANCGLPYHLGGEIAEREKLLLTSPELFWNRFRILVRTEHCVTHFDRQAKTVTGTDGKGEQFKVPYDKLILATGSQPIVPPFADNTAENVFQLWNMEDLDRIMAFMKNRPCRKASVIGGGFVGLEVAEQLKHRKIAVNLVEQGPQLLGRMIDAEMAALVHREVAKQGIQLHLNSSVDKLLISNNRATALSMQHEETIASDLVVLGVGAKPKTELAVAAELAIGADGGVVINEFCQTSDPDIYAVGDIAEYPLGVPGLVQGPSRESSAQGRVPFAGPANRAGRVAGTHAAGHVSKPLGAMQGTSIVRVFDLAVGVTGLTQRACAQANLACRTAVIQAAHHAGYFPGARSLTLKLVYAPDGKILGAQAVGPEGVDKRIDIIATLLQMEGTVDDLADLDLSYAPPFGSAKDPVHMAAFVAQNDLSGSPTLIEPNADLSGLQVVDVRNESELERLPAVPGAQHIPLDSLTEKLDALDRNLPTVTICHSGKRSHVAACRLQGAGFNVKNLSGGMSIRKLFD